MIDDSYIYVFVRQDVNLGSQFAHAGHAVYHMAQAYKPEDGIPHLITIGSPDLKALNRVLHKLQSNQLPHFAWTDPDMPEVGMTAIATAPLNDAQRSVLSNYRLYSRGVEQSACGVTADSGASSLCQSDTPS